MLIFVGLGLQSNGLSIRGLESLEDADSIYAELYTSLIPDLDLSALSKEIGVDIQVLDRERIEDDPSEVLESASKGKTILLVPGDPMIATTHIDLRLRAEKAGIETKIIHGASIETAAPGLVGLQNYKFGRSATIPFSEKPSSTPYEVLVKNQENDFHTLLFLDIEAQEERYLTISEAIEIMLELESRENQGVFTRETLAIGIARAGSENSTIKAGKIKELINYDFGAPPHVLIIPGKLHFLEAEALRTFANASEEVVEEYVK